ncbi:MAG TPA: PQQ-dependent sugar dehydrogenase, partial [Nitrososphaeraceae archaeon]|nr:PQQ-dependent sugar dehydrogenase [Nitrososphaeraceae archaeon]
FLSFPLLLFSFCNIYAQQNQNQNQNYPLSAENITLSDPTLKIELVASGLDFPTTMAFLGPDDFLILEKNTGNVKRFVNGTLVEKPLLHVVSSIKDERGLLGIAISEKDKNDYKNVLTVPNKDVTHNVFLYYIECKDVLKNIGCENSVYRYDLDNKNNVLINPKFLVGVPSFPDPSHIGGIIDIGPDENLYVTVGNFQNTIPVKLYKTKTQNFEDGEPVDGRAGILRLTQDGYPVLNANGTGILGNKYPLNAYYAYGIRNSFGIDFDPVTGKLWDTENGPQFGDEINMVESGFNSGSDRVYGIWEADEFGDMLKNKNGESVPVGNNPPNLVDFKGKGHYSPPEFIWGKTIAPTALLFLDSDKLGSKYQNDMFVGSADGGRVFHFDLNEKRDGLVLKGNLTDKIAIDKTEFADILFAEGFIIITDMKQGPDGYPYIVSGLKQSKTAKFGAVFRIVPSTGKITNAAEEKLDIVKQQTEEEKSNIIPTKTNTNTTTSAIVGSNQENSPKKANTNVLLDIAPKLSNTTKKIDTKAWDNLMKEKLEQTSH